MKLRVLKALVDSGILRAFKVDFNLSKKIKTMCYSDGKFPDKEFEDNGFLTPMELISRPTDENCGSSSKAYSIGYHWAGVVEVRENRNCGGQIQFKGAFVVDQQKVIDSPSAHFYNSMLQAVTGEINGIDDPYPSSGMEVYNTTHYFNEVSQQGFLSEEETKKVTEALIDYDSDSSDESNKDRDLRTPIAPPVTSLRMAKVILLVGTAGFWSYERSDTLLRMSVNTSGEKSETLVRYTKQNHTLTVRKKDKNHIPFPIPKHGS
ncbi:hypothetical protein AgCh_024902 [Apium graveolens]